MGFIICIATVNKDISRSGIFSRRMLIHSCLLILAVIKTLISGSQSMIIEDACVDISPYCSQYAHQCPINPYVQGKCRRTCNLCGDINRMDACVDISPYCARYAYQCDTNSYVQWKCQETCNRCGYMKTSGTCVDKSPNCATNINQCHTNSYVQDNCKKTCNLCQNVIEYKNTEMIKHALTEHEGRSPNSVISNRMDTDLMMSASSNDEMNMNDITSDFIPGMTSDRCVDISPICASHAHQCSSDSFVQGRCQKTCNLCENDVISGVFETMQAPVAKTSSSSRDTISAFKPNPAPLSLSDLSSYASPDHTTGSSLKPSITPLAKPSPSSPDGITVAKPNPASLIKSSPSSYASIADDTAGSSLKNNQTSLSKNSSSSP